MTNTSIASDLLKSLDIHSDLSLQITLDGLSLVDNSTDSFNLIVSQISDTGIRVNPSLCKNTVGAYSSDSEDDSVGATAEDIIENTADFILKELSRKLKGYDLENFVADLLRAMGYRTKVSPQGGDSGIDITAYKDELPPRILVQVKNQNGDINETTIQSLKGAMREGDYGLFVTLSNYTKNAQKYLESTPIIRGINGTELVDLILKYYEDLSEKYRKMIPLKKVYIPVSKEE